MANNYAITPGSGDAVTGVDLTTFTAYPTTGKVPASVVYVSQSSGVAPAAVTTSNPLPVGVQGSVAVTGTFYQATQPVSGTVTANAGTGTMAVSAASLPLPSGAATAAKQPALGTAGSASADVLTVQGVASMTALKVDGSAVTQPVSGSLATVSTVTTCSTVTNLAQLGGAAVAMGTGLRSAGTQRVTIATDDVVPVTGTFWQATQPVSLASVPSHAVTNAGTFAVQATLAAGAASIAKAEDAASADADVGVPAMAVRKAAPANTSGADGDYEMLQVSAGRLWVSAYLDSTLDATNDSVTARPGAATSGGVTPYFLISAATTNATSLKASAGQLYGLQLVNRSTTSAAYFKLFNLAVAPTVGTSTPIKVICVPAAASSSQPTVVLHQQPLGIAFGTGIAFAVTGGSANSDTTAVASGEFLVSLDYK